MSHTLIPGFSPYNVPVRQGKRLGADPRAAPEQQARVQPQAKPSGRWSQPAVDVRLSAAALAFLNGEGDAKAPQASAKPDPVAQTAFGALLDGKTATADTRSAGTPNPPTDSHARYVAPGSKINIIV